MYRWTFTIPISIPSANVLRRTYRNPHAYKRLRDDMGYLVNGFARAIPTASGPRKVRITRLIDRGGKQFDYDNLVSGAKPLLDVLVTMGIILGDGPGQVEVEYIQEKHGSPGTRIELEDPMEGVTA